jgi:fused signal recognition particle receptor
MFGFFKKGLNKTADAIKTVIPKKKAKISKEELEDILLESDVHYDLIEKILSEIPYDEVKREHLESKLLACFNWAYYDEKEFAPPKVQLIIGVNGAGKTTTIAKLSQKYLDEGKKVMLGAADTFRAAAIEQLSRWADKIGVPIVATQQGHDPSAVAFDAIASAKAKGFDNVLIDTAGRLHTQTNLSNELKKIVRICDKAHPGAPHDKILILDGTQGNSAIDQARAFNEMVDIDAIIITKLDGTAKGGSVFSIAFALEIPIIYIGIGEKPEDLVKFDKHAFVSDFLDAIYLQEETA